MSLERATHVTRQRAAKKFRWDSKASMTDNNSRSGRRLLSPAVTRYSREIERTAAGAIVSTAFRISRIQYRRLTIYAGGPTKWMIKKNAWAWGRWRFHRDGRCAKCRFQKRDSNLSHNWSDVIQRFALDPDGYLFFSTTIEISRLVSSVDNIARAHINHHESIVMVNLNILRGNWWSPQTADASNLSTSSWQRWYIPQNSHIREQFLIRRLIVQSCCMLSCYYINYLYYLVKVALQKIIDMVAFCAFNIYMH